MENGRDSFPDVGLRWVRREWSKTILGPEEKTVQSRRKPDVILARRCPDLRKEDGRSTSAARRRKFYNRMRGFSLAWS